MAYYQFDLTMTNLAALPAGTADMVVRFRFSESVEQPRTDYFAAPFPASLNITLDTRDPEPWNQNYPELPFELDPGEKMWIEIDAVRIENGDYFQSVWHVLGPYVVGDEGAEVPPL